MAELWGACHMNSYASQNPLPKFAFKKPKAGGWMRGRERRQFTARLRNKNAKTDSIKCTISFVSSDNRFAEGET